MNEKLRTEEMMKFYEAVLSLENEDECFKFFVDLCTVKELEAMSQRLEVAKLLLKNYTYSQIEEAIGVSTATISRINRALNYGEGGYKLVVERTDK